MSESLKTKNVFLTGGARGIGKSIVDGLLSAGARVLFGDINSALGAATEKEFAEKYGRNRVKFIPFDVTDRQMFEEAFQTAVNFLGNVDLMVNNAGIMNEDLWEKTIQINYAAYVRGTLLAYEHMRKDKGGKGGRIINVSSETALMDYTRLPVYSGAKHAVRAFTSAMAIAPNVKEIGIEYGVLCPGATSTDMVLKSRRSNFRHLDSLSREARRARVASMNPVERIQSGFMKLVLLEDMNGAILEVQADHMSFVKMVKIVQGEKWPVQKSNL